MDLLKMWDWCDDNVPIFPFLFHVGVQGVLLYVLISVARV